MVIQQLTFGELTCFKMAGVDGTLSRAVPAHPHSDYAEVMGLCQDPQTASTGPRITDFTGFNTWRLLDVEVLLSLEAEREGSLATLPQCANQSTWPHTVECKGI